MDFLINKAVNYNHLNGIIERNNVNGIKEVSSSMMEMKMAMQEQTAGSSPILLSLGPLVKITENVILC